MAKPRTLERREFLRLAALAGGAVAVASCVTAPPAAPTKAPEPTKAPAAAAPAAAPTKPAAAATAAPVPTQAPAAATAVARPTQAPVAKVEGPEVIIDPAKLPKTFREAPPLAELVKAGKLPPVEKRLPEEPLVLKPTREIGRYGGIWRAGFTGPADEQNAERLEHDHVIYWDAEVTKVVPHIVKGWDIADDGRTFTLHLRKGMKWSDGEPFTADDFSFWYEDLYLNKDLNPSAAAWMAIGGKEGTMEKVSDTAIRFKFAAPYYNFLEQIASLDVAGHFTRGEAAMGLFSPRHYMKQFHPKYAAKEALDKAVKDAKFDNWVNLFKFKNNPQRNIECPTTAPWMATSPINTPQYVLERNPYYWAVDSEGNQLPYIDKIVMSLAENLEVLNLRAAAGEYDLQVRHIDLAKLPVFKENQNKGNYTVKLWPWPNGTDAGLFLNQNYDADAEIRKWLNNKDFRIALSQGFDRNQLNEIFWLGLGQPGGPAPAANTIYSPGPEYRTLHSTLDPKKANELLDKLGLDKKDAQGFRLRTDGKGRLVLEMNTVAAMFINFTGIAEMVAEHWAKHIGIKANVVEQERSLFFRRNENNELQIKLWANDGSENPWTLPRHLMPTLPESGMGPLSGVWYQTGGARGVKPEGGLLRMVELLEQGKGVPPEKRIELGKEIHRLSAENVWVIGTVGVSPASQGVAIIGNKVGNVPDFVVGSAPGQSIGNARPEQFYFKG